MAKARGLPDSFKLNVSSTITKPVELADYLDEEPSRPVKPKAAPPPPVPVSVPQINNLPEPSPQPALAPNHVRPEEAPVITRTERSESVATEPALFPERPYRLPVPARFVRKVTVPRKQINMSLETLMMVDELVDFIKTYSVQKDITAAEMFHALVLAVFEAREELDLSRVQPRGRWGTPTAAALPIAIKNAMQKAIQKYSETQK